MARRSLISAAHQWLGLLVLCGIMAITSANPGIAEESQDLKDRDFETPIKLRQLVDQLNDADAYVRGAAIQQLKEFGAEAKPAVPKLIELLSDEAPLGIEGVYYVSVQSRAQSCLEAIGVDALTELQGRYRQLPESARPYVNRLILKCGLAASSTLPELAGGFPTASPPDQIGLLASIRALDLNGNTALPLILMALKSNNQQLRITAIDCLTLSDFPTFDAPKPEVGLRDWLRDTPSRTDEIINALYDRLHDETPAARVCAMHALGSFPRSDDRYYQALRSMIQDRSEYIAAISDHTGRSTTVGDQAVQRLCTLTDRADEVFPLIIQTWSTDAFPLEQLPETVLDMVRNAKHPLDTLIPALGQANSQPALISLACLGPQARQALPDLAAFIQFQQRSRPAWASFLRQTFGVNDLLLEHDNQITIVETAWAQFAQKLIDPDNIPDPVDAIETLLNEDSYLLRAVIMRVGPAANFAIPAITRHIERDLAREDHFERLPFDLLVAVQAPIDTIAKLWQAGFKTDRLLYELLDPTVLHVIAPKIMPELLAVLKTSDPKSLEFQKCHDVIRALGKNGKAAIPFLMSQLNTDIPNKRISVIDTISHMACESELCIPALIKLLNDPRADVRRAAAIGLTSFGSEATPAIPALIKTLDDDYLSVRNAAIYSLGKLGPISKAAIPNLTAIKQSEHPHLSTPADWALRQISQ